MADDTPTTDDRLDELEQDVDETRTEAEEHGTIPGKKQPTLEDPNPDGPGGGKGMPSPSAF